MAESNETLARVPLLSGVGRKELGRLAQRMTARTFAAGETAIEEGRGGAGFWMIESGEADVLVSGNAVRRLGSGDYFGEIALIDDGPRSATVVAASEMRCMGLAPWEFKAFLAEHPEAAWTVMQTLASRLREAEARPGA
jgi:CRP/FNR family cyclic AMP-dependent transcriptional regulator